MSPHADAKSPDRLSAETVLQDSSLAEGAAGLLAMTSTADPARDMQVAFAFSPHTFLSSCPVHNCPAHSVSGASCSTPESESVHGRGSTS